MNDIGPAMNSEHSTVNEGSPRKGSRLAQLAASVEASRRRKNELRQLVQRVSTKRVRPPQAHK